MTIVSSENKFPLSQKKTLTLLLLYIILFYNTYYILLYNYVSQTLSPIGSRRCLYLCKYNKISRHGPKKGNSIIEI